MPGWRGRQGLRKPCLQQSIPQLQERSWGFLPAPRGAQMAGDQPLELCCWQEGAWDGGRAFVHQHVHGENVPPAASAAVLLPARVAPPLHGHQFTLTHLRRQRHGHLLQERLWEQGEALGKREAKEPEDLRWVTACLQTQRLELGEPQWCWSLQDQWWGEPGWRAGQVQEASVRIWWAKGEQAESCDGDEPYSGAVEKCSGSRTTFSPELPSLSLFFSL